MKVEKRRELQEAVEEFQEEQEQILVEMYAYDLGIMGYDDDDVFYHQQLRERK